MIEVNWGEPPPEVLFKHENRGGKYVDFAHELRQHPGKWATMPEGYTNTEQSARGGAQNIRRGGLKGFTRGYYDAIADGTTVWVRCKPEVEWPENKDKDDDKDKAGDEPDFDDGPGRIEVEAMDPVKVRSWARENGWPELSDRGRLSDEIQNGYRAAHSLPDD